MPPFLFLAEAIDDKNAGLLAKLERVTRSASV
jgi:hypothetical protein